MPSNIFEIDPMGATNFGDYRDAYKEDNYGNPDSVEFEFLVDYRTNPNINPGHPSNFGRDPFQTGPSGGGWGQSFSRR